MKRPRRQRRTGSCGRPGALFPVRVPPPSWSVCGLRRRWPEVRVSLLSLGPLPVSAKAGGCREGRHCGGEPGPSTWHLASPASWAASANLPVGERLPAVPSGQRSSSRPTAVPSLGRLSRPHAAALSPPLRQETQSSAWACRTAALTPRLVLAFSCFAGQRLRPL